MGARARAARRGAEARGGSGARWRRRAGAPRVGRVPSRLAGRTCAVELMFSWPPATMTEPSPQMIACAARCTALRPLPQTLSIVIAGVSTGRPAFIAACEARNPSASRRAAARRARAARWRPRGVRGRAGGVVWPTWRAGFCPRPAVSTFPMMTSSTRDLSTPARASAAEIAAAPSAGAGSLASAPPKAPTAVRAALMITGFDMKEDTMEERVVLGAI